MHVTCVFCELLPLSKNIAILDAFLVKVVKILVFITSNKYIIKIYFMINLIIFI